MEYQLIFRDKAVFEIEDAYEFYEMKSKGLGKKFIETVKEYLDKIEENPAHFQKKLGEVREAYIKKFPFVIVYEIHEFRIVIYSVFHTSRNPKNKN
ncbi:type II toxin-antitoxin system RelE/ParE family toxin [Chryseobacterium koreense]|uniref:Plasmid stabilization system n=1 Tax=Chryseobacterium koreense CCUG 49689 TaxID=1304281 RepID=A0A0J7J0P5_9FLAO|nr:type II toxin-antitoxin system RelE/ParE family toxin [Chryseobacterium koreense]KMQ71614.1 hypothetical protein ACM44_05130 [Chryseobacterium koreense CCUG 49689]MBB5333268.1 mRNA-degrading endonuclease RelE of RelBE toxin-antitoxin system [Chryseobacterium koreense]